MEKIKKELKILFGMPSYTGQIANETMLSLLSLIHYQARKYPHHEITFDIRVRNFVTYAAEKITETAVEGRYDYLFYLGDDVVFRPNTLETMLNHDKDVVALAVFARSQPFALYAFDESLKNFHVNRLNTGLQKASAAGTGVTLFKMDVFNGLNKPWWRWPNQDDMDCDKEFFLRLKKEKDIDVWVDTDNVAGHIDFSHGIIDQHAHLQWIDSVKKSGVLEKEEVKKHKDFPLLEALVNG